MHAFFSEYGYVFLAIMAFSALTIFTVILIKNYDSFNVSLISGITGVPVEEITAAEEWLNSI